MFGANKTLYRVRYLILSYGFYSVTFDSKIKYWVTKWAKFRSNVPFIVKTFSQDKYLSLWQSCTRGYDLSSGRHYDATETMDVPRARRWFKYLEARGRSVTLRCVTIIFFLSSRSRRIRFSASPVSQPLPPPRRFALVLRGYYLREVPIPHCDDESLKPSRSFLPSGISLKIWGVTLIKPRMEYHCFSNLVIEPWLCCR